MIFEMKKQLLPYLLIGLLTIVSVNCKQPYIPPANTVSVHYLVVEGVINTSNDSTIIKLSRTVTLSGKTVLNPEKVHWLPLRMNRMCPICFRRFKADNTLHHL